MEKKKEFQTEERTLLPFDPIVILRDILIRWRAILIITALVGLVSYAAVSLCYQPSYRTNTTLVVTTRGSSSTVYANRTSTAELATVFTEIVESAVFHKIVQEEAQLPAFDGKVTVSQVTDTNLLTMQVSSADPRTAFLVTRAILSNYEAVTQQVMGDVVLEVLQAPTVPVAPSNPMDIWSVMRKAMLIAIVLLCVLFGWISYSRDTVRSSKEARKKLDCNYLGELPHERKYKTLRSRIRRPKHSILICNPATSFLFSEAVRKLRSRVEQHMAGGKVLMVVSLLENEGKSTVAINLAISMARKNLKVLLIDCDLRKPACAKQLNVDWKGPDVRDVLVGRADPAKLVIRDSSSKLHLLLAQNSYANSGTLINSPNMTELLRWARENYDFVVLDLPPMSQVTDAESVMEMADSSLLVVRQNAAHAKALNKAIASLNRGKAKLVGCVLNNVYATALSSGQGQGNYYRRYNRYGQYSRYGQYGRYGRYGAYGTNETGKQD